MKNNLIQFIILFILVICFLYGCGHQVNDVVERSEDNELIYNGTIDSKNFAKLKKVYEDAVIKPSLLKINSPGGSGKVGIDMGHWIYRADLSVEVTEICASSCANYIFPAGKQKILGKHALLVLHEGAYQTDIATQIEAIYRGDDAHEKGGDFTADKDGVCNVSAYLTTDNNLETIEETKGLDCIDKYIEETVVLKAKESSFYLLLGIDPNYPYYGQKDKRYIGKESLYYYSMESLDTMGLGNISLKDDQWTPEQSSAYREALFLVDTNFSAFMSSAAQLGMTKFQQFIYDNNTILPSHQTWLYLVPELLTKHQSLVAMSSNKALAKTLLAKLNSTNYRLKNQPLSIVCGPKECEIQITYFGSFTDVLAIDWKTIIGNTPQLKFSNLSVDLNAGAGIIVTVSFIDA